MASLARDPVAHRLSAKLKFDEALRDPFDPSLGALRERDPTFPVGDGNHPFAQMRSFLFMDVLTSEEDDRRMREMIAADASRALVGADAVGAGRSTRSRRFAPSRPAEVARDARAARVGRGRSSHPVAGVAGEGVVELLGRGVGRRGSPTRATRLGVANM